MARPTTSAAGARPFTAGGAAHPGTGRPTTSAGAPSTGDQDDQYYRGQQYTYSLDEEDEDESEPEDVFAYLPPTTADLEAAPSASGSHPFGYSQELASPPMTGVGDPLHAHHHIQSPDPQPFASSHPPDTPRTPAIDSPLMAPPPLSHTRPPPDTPPSTISASSADGHYRMHRLDTSGTQMTGRTQSSREHHISLPHTADEEKGVPQSSLDGQDVVVLSKHAQPLSSAGGSAHSRGAPSIAHSEGSIKMEFDFDAVDEEDSPYPEVRASVSNVDDPEMPAMTIRMWVIGLLLCMGGGAMNVFFNFRYPAPQVVPLVLLLLAYPVGKFCAFVLPITVYRLPSWLPLVGGETFSFNPGPWNIKEHVLVYIMSNVAVGTPYALNAIVVADRFYGVQKDYWFSLVLVLATQLTGFGLAGMCRRFLVWPASMVWPQNLVACTLLNTLHAEEDEGTGGVTRYRFFIWAACGAFFFYFFPGFLFQALSVFSWVCWAAPKNVPVNQLFGVANGLGMSVLTFDWTQIAFIGSPLMVPWWAQLHIFSGFVLFFWIITPALYYSNTWNVAHFPISANDPYDNQGNVYNVSRVLSADSTFDEAAFNAYSPLYLPSTYAMTYLLAFALSTCVIVHTLLYHGRSIVNGVKRIRVEKDDIHAKLMRSYPEVPDWWYALAFLAFFSLAIVAVEVWDTGVPVWALVLAVILPIVYVLPSGFIFAMTGQGITVNLLAQIIPGTLLPGKPLANMIFKAYAVQTLSEAQSFTQDLKLGHYIKVPPRATFMVQLVATILAAFVQVGVKDALFSNIPDMCSPTQASHLTCPHNKVFFTASAIWGLIGPSRQFGPNSIYYPLVWATIVGACLPLPFWLWERRHPKSFVRYINTPIILNGIMYLPPATGINYSSWFLVGFIFQYLIRRRNFAWWSNFNYVTSAALDSGTAISLIIIFLALNLPKDGKIQLNWWGNEVFKHTADAQKLPLRPIPLGTTIS